MYQVHGISSFRKLKSTRLDFDAGTPIFVGEWLEFERVLVILGGSV